MTPITSNPLPEVILPSGLAVELVDVLQLPASDSELPLTRLNHLTHAGDGSGRLFAADSRGTIHLIENGALAATPFLDVAAAVGADFNPDGNSLGIRSIAFHPDFETPGQPGFGKFYTVTTESPAGAAASPDTPILDSPAASLSHHDVVSEWTLDTSNPDIIDASSRRQVLRIEQPTDGHNTDLIAFNPNAAPGEADYGKLYLAVGDGGNAEPPLSDAFGFGQNTQVALGKILRIDPLADADSSYQVPGDNPYVDDATFLPEIWAYGLRNPQRYSWDSGGDGKMLIGDIGQFHIEEVNLGMAGANYGWGLREGTFETEPSDQTVIYDLPVDDAQFGFTYPVAQYDHDEGRAITAGFVYRGAAIPELQGQYVFGDIRSGRIFHTDADTLQDGQQAVIHELTLLRNGVPVTLLEVLGNDSRADLRFGADEAGEIYLTTKRDGFIRTLRPADPEGAVFTYDPAPGDFDGDDTILLSALGGQLAYLANRDSVSITDEGGVIQNATWRDEIAGADALRIDFTAAAIDIVKIEMNRLGAGEAVLATVRDGGGALLGQITIPGQGSSGDSSFVHTIGQGDLDTAGAIASVTLTRANGGTSFVVGQISATQAGAGGSSQPPDDIAVSASTFDENAAFAATLTANDPDTPAGSITYGLETDPSGAFQINGNQISLTAPLDFENLPAGFVDQGNGTATIGLLVSANDGSNPAYNETVTFTLNDLDETPGGGGQIVSFDPSAGDFDGNADIQLSATGGLLTYLANRDAVSVDNVGGVQANGTWQDEIAAGDELRIDFASASIETVDIEFKRLGAGEVVTAEVRDASNALLGTVNIPGQGSSGSSVFTATIDQGDLDTTGAIDSITLSRATGGTAFVVGEISATESSGGAVAALTAESDLAALVPLDGDDSLDLGQLRDGSAAPAALRGVAAIDIAELLQPADTLADGLEAGGSAPAMNFEPASIEAGLAIACNPQLEDPDTLLLGMA